MYDFSKLTRKKEREKYMQIYRDCTEKKFSACVLIFRENKIRRFKAPRMLKK